ncbi:hypothetical protein AB0E04_27585 [Streptomyces sp. NPDC048251]|uniref:hypothetical protein n=1 Tax=Streptomyces sp. NPDC048251 TaxID=3154501 RepID=UPI0034155D9C
MYGFYWRFVQASATASFGGTYETGVTPPLPGVTPPLPGVTPPLPGVTPPWPASPRPGRRGRPGSGRVAGHSRAQGTRTRTEDA